MLLTGRHPIRVGTAPEVGGELDLDETTIAEGLKTNGYRTGVFGKWHNVSDPDTPEFRAAPFPSPRLVLRPCSLLSLQCWVPNPCLNSPSKVSFCIPKISPMLLKGSSSVPVSSRWKVVFRIRWANNIFIIPRTSPSVLASSIGYRRLRSKTARC